MEIERYRCSKRETVNHSLGRPGVLLLVGSRMPKKTIPIFHLGKYLKGKGRGVSSSSTCRKKNERGD